jgi:hypothetical protein
VQLGYNLGPSGVITAAIDATMIVPDYLADGSEGFGLDWDIASPMLDKFFGVTVAAEANGARVNARVSEDDDEEDAADTVDAEPAADATRTRSGPRIVVTASPTPRKQR